MPAEHFFAEDPREVGLDPAKVEALFVRAEREVKDGLLPSTQIAIARKGKIAAMRTVGRAVQGGVEKPATNSTLYVIFSCTKAIMSSSVWILMQEGKLKVSERVADIVPEFGTNGKDKITVEQVLLHVSGFPNAPFPPADWPDRSRRLERFSKWRLEWPVGSKFEYHPTSGFWVIAEIIERRTG
jgi:CubicO group peptidase (beta-lactamase class C family)